MHGFYPPPRTPPTTPVLTLAKSWISLPSPCKALSYPPEPNLFIKSLEPYTLSCQRYPIEGYQNGGMSGPGKAGGSAISPQGWLFNICDDQERCLNDPTFGLSIWFRQLWLVRHMRLAG